MREFRSQLPTPRRRWCSRPARCFSRPCESGSMTREQVCLLHSLGLWSLFSLAPPPGLPRPPPFLNLPRSPAFPPPFARCRYACSLFKLGRLGRWSTQIDSTGERCGAPMSGMPSSMVTCWYRFLRGWAKECGGNTPGVLNMRSSSMFPGGHGQHRRRSLCKLSSPLLLGAEVSSTL